MANAAAAWFDPQVGGRSMAEGTNRQVGEVAWLFRQYDPGQGCHVRAEHPCAFAIRRVDSQRAKTDGHGIASSGRPKVAAGERRDAPEDGVDDPPPSGAGGQEA